MAMSIMAVIFICTHSTALVGINRGERFVRDDQSLGREFSQLPQDNTPRADRYYSQFGFCPQQQ